MYWKLINEQALIDWVEGKEIEEIAPVCDALVEAMFRREVPGEETSTEQYPYCRVISTSQADIYLTTEGSMGWNSRHDKIYLLDVISKPVLAAV